MSLLYPAPTPIDPRDRASHLAYRRYTTTRASFGECTGPRPAAYKILRQPSADPTLASLCAHTASPCVFAHIRAASPGSAVAAINNHPFIFGRHAFMHNGGVAHFPLIRRRLALDLSPAAHARLVGTTDSELLAALFFTHLERARGPDVWDAPHPLDEMRACLEQTLQRVLAVQIAELAAEGAGTPLEASSLNIAITDGEQLLAIRFRNHATEHPPSLYLSTRAGVALNRKFPGHPDLDGVDNGAQNLLAAHEHGDHVIVASEPTTFRKEDWELIPKNTCVMVGKDMSVKREPVRVTF